MTLTQVYLLQKPGRYIYSKNIPLFLKKTSRGIFENVQCFFKNVQCFFKNNGMFFSIHFDGFFDVLRIKKEDK